MYLHIGRNQMLAERRIIGIFDLEITSQSKTTRAFLDRAQQEGTVLEVCDDLPLSLIHICILFQSLHTEQVWGIVLVYSSWVLSEPLIR